MTLLEERNIRAYDLWQLAMQQTDWDEKLRLLEQSSQLDAYRPNVWLALSKCYFRIRRYDDCANAIDMGLLVDEHDKYLLDAKMMLELNRGNTPGALAVIDRMLEPASSRERNNLVRLKVSILIDSDMYDEAIDQLRKLTHRPHPSMKDLVSLGLLAERQGDMQLAVRTFTRLRKMKPKDRNFARHVEDFFLRHP